MEWRLNVMTIVAKGVIMATMVIAGANIVHNVTAALEAMTHGCETGIAHLL
jgi:hypothetical protein